MMRADRKSYATGAVRAWLEGRHKIRLQQQPFRILVPLTIDVARCSYSRKD